MLIKVEILTMKLEAASLYCILLLMYNCTIPLTKK